MRMPWLVCGSPHDYVMRKLHPFQGGDGILSHDVILVVEKIDGRVLGVYHVPWGR